MPKLEEPAKAAKSKPTPPPQPKPEPVQIASPTDRKVFYPLLHARCHFEGPWLAGSDENGNPVELQGEGALTGEDAKVLLDWMDETEFNAAMQEENPGAITAEGVAVEYGYDSKNMPDSLFTDRTGKKVRCCNVVGNRWFDDRYTKGYMQSILKRVWAGPTAFPEEAEFELEDGSTITLPLGTINGETVVISRTSRVDSGQKRLVALVWACQEWEKDEYWKQWWPDGPPTMDCLIIYGTSEDPRVVQTLDQVQPRSEADQLYTGPAFVDLNKNDKKLLSRVSAGCLDILWSRTWDGSKENTRETIKTGIAAMGFWDRHPTIQDCVRYTFDVERHTKEDGTVVVENYLATMKLPKIVCAAAMYLMASSATDRDTQYTPTNGVPPCEAKIDWQHLDTAKQFWKDAAEADLDCLREALRALANPNDPDQSGSNEQKLAVLALAWAKYLEGGKDAVNVQKDVNGTVGWDLDSLSLAPYYVKTDKGMVPKGFPTFGGIDLGRPEPVAKKASTPEEIKARRAEENKTRRDEEAKKLVASSGGIVSMPLATGLHEMEEGLENLHQRFPGHLIIFTNVSVLDKDGKPTKEKVAQCIEPMKVGGKHDGDATTLNRLLGAEAPARLDKGFIKARFPMNRLISTLRRIVESGQSVAVAEVKGDKLITTVWTPEPAEPEGDSKNEVGGLLPEPEPIPEEPDNEPEAIGNGEEDHRSAFPREEPEPTPEPEKLKRTPPKTIRGVPTRNETQAEQTRKAAEADKKMAEERAAAANKKPTTVVKSRARALSTKPTKGKK